MQLETVQFDVQLIDAKLCFILLQLFCLFLSVFLTYVAYYYI